MRDAGLNFYAMDEELRRFDAIRPFEPEEVPGAIDRMLADEQFRAVLTFAVPGVPFDKLVAQMKECHTCLDFQLKFCYHFLDSIVKKMSDGCDMDCEAVSKEGRYTFVSNHRDIVLDSALLDKLLIDSGFGTTCEIAIGDNLLAAPWIKDLVRLNKSFIVERSVGMREMLASSKRMSEYMHYVIARKNDNIWIAQREGRAKDSDDRTQPSVLKMMAMGGDGSVANRLRQLHIVPLTISYEYDPCDYLKAREFQLKRDVKNWKKTKADDVLSMQTGIMGRKGRIHYHCAPCIDGFLDTLPADMPKGELFETVAHHIDHEVHLNYRLYPGNYVAAHLLWPDKGFDGHFNVDERKTFVDYIESRLAMIELPNRDEQFLRECLLKMYANPVRNHFAVMAE